MKRFSGIALALALSVGFSPATGFSQSPFESGWSLAGESSDLNFLSVKKGTKMELSKFAALSGTIDETGVATFDVALDSVDTSVDLRNVRMRFLLFETFNHPTARITTQLTEAMLGDLEETGVLRLDLPFEIALHGFKKQMTAEVIVSLAGPDQVTVASVAPLILQLADFDLMGGRDKLQETAEVTITPATAITFALTFRRNTPSAVQPVRTLAKASNTALEPEGNFSAAACEGRFEILSRAGNIYFEKNASNLTPESNAILASISLVMRKCPGMVVEVGGHTDSSGPNALNLRLSQSRADAVVQSLVAQGVNPALLVSRGYGEAAPIASNSTHVGRGKNRRIEFKVLDRQAALRD